MKRRHAAVLGAIVLALLSGAMVVSWLLQAPGVRLPPRAAVWIFEHRSLEGWPQCTHADPLHRGRDGTMELLTRRVGDRQMRRRWIAIGFLGSQRVVIALPVLATIAADPTEKDLMRATALSSVAMIRREEAERLAKEASPGGEYFERARDGILRGEATMSDAEPLTYEDFLAGRQCR